MYGSGRTCNCDGGRCSSGMLIGLLLNRCKVRTIDVKLELELPTPPCTACGVDAIVAEVAELSNVRVTPRAVVLSDAQDVSLNSDPISSVVYSMLYDVSTNKTNNIFIWSDSDTSIAH